MQSSEQEKAVLVWQSRIIVRYKFQATLPDEALVWGFMRELSGVVNVTGKVSMLKLAGARISKSNMPFHPVFVFALKQEWA